MHELSVCLALIEQIERIGRENDAETVSRIILKIGPLSGIEASLLRHAWPLARAGTIAERADLDIVDTDVRIRCTQCGAESSVPANRLLCSDCGDFRTKVISGDDLILERVEFGRAPPGEDRDEPDTQQAAGRA
jgi:hydrogenase nickel incorporation protein HypA/HybF